MCKTGRVDAPKRTSDVLAQPTRARLFSAVQASVTPISTEKLATELGLHVNGVRRHLERLREAGLIESRKSSGGPGRPRDQWSVAPEADPGGERPLGYADLSRWLAQAFVPGARRLREVERTGREIGRDLASPDGEPTAADFEAALAALGFKPTMAVGDEGEVSCKLCNCPYRDAVRENQSVVCTLHRGITVGLLDRLAPGAELSLFEPHDPDRAGCRVEVTGTRWERPEDRP